MTAPTPAGGAREALEACPFCGGQPTSRWRGASAYSDDDGYWGIDCCQAFAHEDTEAEAIAAWNRRPPRGPAGASEVADRLEALSKAGDPVFRIDGRDYLLDMSDDGIIALCGKLYTEQCESMMVGHRLLLGILRDARQMIIRLAALRAAPSGGWREVAEAWDAIEDEPQAHGLQHSVPGALVVDAEKLFRVELALRKAGLLPPPPGSAGRG